MSSNRSSAKNSISISLETISRNSDLVKEHLLRQMRESLAVGKRLTGEECTGLTFVLKPIVLNLYSNLVQKDLEQGTIKTINQRWTIKKYIPLSDVVLLEIIRQQDKWVKKKIPLTNNFVGVNTNYIESCTFD